MRIAIKTKIKGISAPLPTSISSVNSYLDSIAGKINYISKTIPYIFAEISDIDWQYQFNYLKKNPNIDIITLDNQLHLQALAPAPPPAQTVLLSEAINSTKVKDLWAKGLTGKNVRIAIADTGIDKNHPMFIDNNGITKVIKEGSFGKATPDDIMGHGTFVASCAAGYEWDTGNGILYGASPDAKLINVNVMSDDGAIYQSSLSAGIDWLFTPESNGGAGGADIVSMSIGQYIPQDFWEMIIYTIINNNCIPVASIGNNGSGICTAGYPGAYKKVISVGSYGLHTPNVNGAAAFSSRGPGEGACKKPEFVAPGGNKYYNWAYNGEQGGDENIVGAIPSALISTMYAAWRGTSFSCPIVSGILACIKENIPIQKIYYDTVKNNDTGFGIIDAVKLYNNMYKASGSISKTKLLNVINNDPYIIKGNDGTWTSNGVFCPTPYYINNSHYIYYLPADLSPDGIGLAIYDPNTLSYGDIGKVIPNACTAPGILQLNNLYYAFYGVVDYSTGTYKLYRSESSDGIVWVNEQYISDLNDIAYRISVVNFNDQIIIYTDNMFSVNYGTITPIKFYVYDLTSNSILDSGICYDILASEFRDIGTVIAPYCYLENDKVIMIVSGTIYRPWYLMRFESVDGKAFTLITIEMINNPKLKDYNMNGYCSVSEYNNKRYYATGTFTDVFFDPTFRPKIYVETL